MTATYEELLEKFQTARKPNMGKPLENNTRLFLRDGDAFAVRLHETDVVVHFPDGGVQINTDGWWTTLTKDRVRGYSPVDLYTTRKGDRVAIHEKARLRAARRLAKREGIELEPGTWRPKDRFNDWMTLTQDERNEHWTMVRRFTNLVLKEAEVPYYDGIKFDRNGHVINERRKTVIAA